MPNDVIQRDAIELRTAMVVRADGDDERAARFVFSTDALDSYGERVAQNWDLKRFSSNPVALFAHRSRELPIGHAKDVGVIDGALQGTIVFATAEANPLAEQVWQSIQQGTLRTVSVGFYPHTVRLGKENDREILVLDDNELFEISVTPVPANPEAVMRLRQRAAVESADPMEVRDLITGAVIGRARGAISSLSSPERGATSQETNDMPAEDKTDALATLKAELNIATRDRDAAVERADKAEAENKVLDGQNKRLVEERDAAVERANAADKALVERDVDALVGVKITPAERDDMVELAADKPELFARLMKQRSPLPHKPAGTKVPLADDQPAIPQRATSNEGAGEDLGASIDNRAGV